MIFWSAIAATTHGNHNAVSSRGIRIDSNSCDSDRKLLWPRMRIPSCRVLETSTAAIGLGPGGSDFFPSSSCCYSQIKSCGLKASPRDLIRCAPTKKAGNSSITSRSMSSSTTLWESWQQQKRGRSLCKCIRREPERVKICTSRIGRAGRENGWSRLEGLVAGRRTAERSQIDSEQPDKSHDESGKL